MNKPKVIAIDDQADNLRMMVEILKSDYSVIASTDPLKAVELAQKSPIAVAVLLDVSMPEVSGYEVISQLKSNELTRNIPVIFVTADDQEKDYQKGLELGAFDFVTKPISPSLLKARVRNAINAH